MLMRTLILGLLILAFVPATAGAVTISSTQTVTGTNYGTQQVVVTGGSGVTVTFDNVTWGAFNASSNTYEGRLEVTGNANVIVKNSTFGPGGCSDGINTSGGGNVTVQNTEFTGIKQGSCSPVHVDPIQPYGASSLTVTDSWFHGNSTGIMDPDCNGGQLTIRNNAFVTDGEYPDQILVAGGNGDIFEHNVFANGASIRFGNPNGCGLNSNEIVRNNVITGGLNLTNGQSTSSFTMAQNPSSVTYTGGTGRCQYATASPKGTATDGTDVGLNDCSAPPPPPPVDHTPVARFTAAPEPSTTGQQVTFDATASTCEDTPCTYHWHDTGPPVGTDCNQGGDWPIGTDGSTTTTTFSTTGTKCVELVLTDADGDIDRVLHAHEVTDTPPPPPADTTPPETTFTSQPSDGPATTVTVAFTGTDNVALALFECRIDGGNYSPCTDERGGTAQYSSLAVGQHTIDVRAKDTSGNYDPTPATVTWTVQPPPPPPPSTPPTFVSEAETSWTTTTATKSVTMTVAAGDVLVAYTMAENNAQLSVSSSNVTWTAKVVDPGAANARSSASIWSATVPAGVTSTTVTFSRTGTGQYGGDVLRFRGSSGIGAVGACHTGQSGCATNPAVTLAGVSANSAIVKANVDWSAKSGASRNSLTAGVGAFSETSYNLSSQYTIYGGYHANAGTAGSKTVGYSAPTGQTYTLAAVEVKGT